MEKGHIGTSNRLVGMINYKVRVTNQRVGTDKEHISEHLTYGLVE